MDTTAPNPDRLPLRISAAQWASRLAQWLIDLLVLALAFEAAYLLRFEFEVPAREVAMMSVRLPLVVLLQALTAWLAGVQSFVWRYIGMAEVKTFMAAALYSALPLIGLRLFLPDALEIWRVPLSVIIMDSILGFGGLLGVRVIRRALHERIDPREGSRSKPADAQAPVLLIGAGRTGILAAREIQSNRSMDVTIRGFVDDDPNKHGSVIQGIRVLGSTKDLAHLVRKLGIDHVVITIDELSRDGFKRIRDTCAAVPVKVRIVPTMSEILQGRLSFSRIRDVQIEDLLGRAPVQLDLTDLARLVTNRIVLVTGAGGSIGSELARQVARFQPAKLLLVERSEFALFNIDRELQAARPELTICPLLADVGHESRIRTILEQHRPHVVLHAAAHKHVPMMESNPTEAISNNVLATCTLGKAAGQAGVEVFVLISTDKAVRPTSIMGASKRLTELVVQSLDHAFATRYVAVRFGNVIGSAGSVIPLFREQIRSGGPVVVTDAEMVRYFMTIPEAAQLVLQAAAMGEGGEIFILDMGEPVRILDLAKETIRLSGLRPFVDMDIVFSGLRPGEKLFEELEMHGEQMTKTRHPKIFIGRIAPYSDEKLAHILEQLAFLARSSDEAELRLYLNRILPEAQLRVPDENERRRARSWSGSRERAAPGHAPAG